jgi:hypothetical protein
MSSRIRWLIALMVLRCDPLAIALTAAASAKGIFFVSEDFTGVSPRRGPDHLRCGRLGHDAR